MEKDHEDQAVDTDIPDPDYVDMETWEKMRNTEIALDEEGEE